MTNYTEHDDATMKIIGVKQGPRKMSIVHMMCVCVCYQHKKLDMMMYKRHRANHLDTHVSIQVVSAMSLIHQDRMVPGSIPPGAPLSLPCVRLGD